MSDEKPMGQVIQIDEARIRDHLGELVRGTVEETLNAMLDAEADQLCGAGRYERSQARQDTRAGSYERTLQTSAGEVNLKVPKLRRQTFETAIIDRYRRRESSVEEALIEMYLAGISVRRVEDITEALWGTRVSPSTVSNLNKKIYAKIEAWRNRRIEGEHPYLYLDGIVMKRTWAGEVRNVSLLVASAVNSEGFREILGICEGAKGKPEPSPDQMCERFWTLPNADNVRCWQMHHPKLNRNAPRPQEAGHRTDAINRFASSELCRLWNCPLRDGTTQRVIIYVNKSTVPHSYISMGTWGNPSSLAPGNTPQQARGGQRFLAVRSTSRPSGSTARVPTAWSSDRWPETCLEA